MNRFRSLTSRLVLTAVALVVIVSVGVATATTLLLRQQQVDQLDRKLTSSLGRYPDADDNHPSDADDQARAPLDLRNLGPGTLIAVPDVKPPRGEVIGTRPGESSTVSSAALDRLKDVPVDGAVHQVDLPGLGTYRVVAVRTMARLRAGEPPEEVAAVTGLPLKDVQSTVATLIGWEVLLVLAGVAAATGLGLFVVRRQLAPLREVAATAHRVAELPLETGEIELSERVPPRLTDERTEVGQVGAALNTMLDHVESSLASRQRSEQQVRQFVADASHELRTPLSTIRGYAELARRRPGDVDATRTALDRVESASDRMSSLVEDLLLLARLDAGRPLESAPVDLSKLLVEAVSDARVLAPDHHWKLDLPAEEVVVDGDEQRLHQVVTNLLTNAGRYTPAGTTVTARARSGQLTVHDDGPGFPPEIVDRAFERFVRGDESRTRNGATPGDGGSGLGLSLVEAITRAHGGLVSLDSAPGSTTVRVTLPRRASAPAGHTT